MEILLKIDPSLNIKTKKEDEDRKGVGNMELTRKWEKEYYKGMSNRVGIAGDWGSEEGKRSSRCTCVYVCTGCLLYTSRFCRF